MNNNNLEQILEQVSLLNRLIELLIAEQHQFEVTKYSGHFVDYSDEEFRSLPESKKYNCRGEKMQKYISNPPKYMGKEIQVDGKSLTQKEWSDELVQIAKALNISPFVRAYLMKGLYGVCFSLFGRKVCDNILDNEDCESMLNAILNKYGRSLIETKRKFLLEKDGTYQLKKESENSND